MNKPAAAKIALPLHETECDGTYYVESADHKGVCITDDTVLALGERAYVAESAAKVNAQTIRDQQARIRELEAQVAITRNNLDHAKQSLVEEHERAELLSKRLTDSEQHLADAVSKCNRNLERLESLKTAAATSVRDLIHRDNPMFGTDAVERATRRLSDAMMSLDSRLTEGH